MRLIRSVLVCLMAMAGPGVCFAARQAIQPRIGLYVFNYADVPENVVKSAEKHAARIFGHAGIHIDWIEVTDPGYLPTCPADFETAPCCMLRIQRRLNNGAFPQEVAGYAIRDSPYATVVFGKIEEEASAVTRAQSLVLGYTMAHEIGHIFLPAGYHSLEGIMQRRFDEKSWAMAERGMLLFSSKEAQWLRQNLLSHRPNVAVANGLQPED